MDLGECIMTCTGTPDVILQRIFTALKILCAPPIQLSPDSQSLETTDFITVSIVLPFPECHIAGIIPIAFSDFFHLVISI